MTGCLTLLAFVGALLGLGVYSSSDRASLWSPGVEGTAAAPKVIPSLTVPFVTPAWAKAGERAMEPQVVKEAFGKAIPAIERRLGDRGSVYLTAGRGFPRLVVTSNLGSGLTRARIAKLVTTAGDMRLALVASADDMGGRNTTQADELIKLDRWIEAGGSFAGIDRFNDLAPSDGGPADGLWWALERSAKEASPRPLLLVRRTGGDVVDGSWFDDFRRTVSSDGAQSVFVDVRPEREEEFARWTGAHTRRQLAVVVGNEVVTAPTLNGPLRSGFLIEGRFSVEEVDDLIAVLRHPLPSLPIVLAGR